MADDRSLTIKRSDMAEELRSGREWERLFTEQSRSGMTMREFCESRGINYSTFKNRRYRLTGGSSSKVEIVEISRPPVKAVATVVLPNSRRLELTSGFDEVELKRLIAVLESC